MKAALATTTLRGQFLCAAAAKGFEHNVTSVRVKCLGGGRMFCPSYNGSPSVAKVLFGESKMAPMKNKFSYKSVNIYNFCPKNSFLIGKTSDSLTWFRMTIQPFRRHLFL
jgi:hypothetical protein